MCVRKPIVYASFSSVKLTVYGNNATLMWQRNTYLSSFPPDGNRISMRWGSLGPVQIAVSHASSSEPPFPPRVATSARKDWSQPGHGWRTCAVKQARAQSFPRPSSSKKGTLGARSDLGVDCVA
ncbi:hypothetical protein V2G26_011557 [Clonostachys chloroleuca]